MGVSRESNNLEQVLRRVAAGDLDRLTPKQIELLQRVLNTNPAVVDRVADQCPPGDELMRAADAAGELRSMPTAGNWERAWARINSAVSAPVSASRNVSRLPLVQRLWQPLAAAAACLLLIVLSSADLTPAGDAWPLEPATDIEICELVVYDNATSFVVSTGGEDGFEVVWVLEEES